MADTSVTINIDVDAGQVKSNLDAVCEQFRRASSGINAALSGIKGFAELKRQVDETAAAYGEAQRKVAELARIMASGAGGARVAADFEKAKKAAAELKETLTGQRQALAGLRGGLAAAGVATANLVPAQQQLRAAMSALKGEYQNLAEVASARDTLGVKPHIEIQREIDKTRQALADLKKAHAEGRITSAEFAQAQGRAAQRIRELREQTNGLEQQIGKLRNAWAGLAAIVGGVATLKTVTRQFVEFDDAMRRVGAVSQESAENMAKLTKQAQELGATTRFTASDAARAMQQLAAAGLKQEEIQNSIGAAMNIAAAGQMDVATAADQLTNIMGQFGIEAKDSAIIADALTAGFTGAATSMDQLANAMTYCGPVANSLGYTMQDTTGILMALADAGIKGEKAGTALRGGFSRLLNPIGEAKEVIEKYGLEVQNADGTMKSFADIIDAVGRAGMSSKEQIQLFGLEAGPAMMTLLQKGGDAIRKYQDQVNNSGGMAEKVAGDMEEGLGGAMRRLEAATSAIAVNFGKVWAPALGAVADMMAKVAGWVADLSDGAKMAVSAIGAVATGFVVWRKALVPLYSGLVSIPKAILALRNAEQLAEANAKRLNAEMARVGPVAAKNFGQAGAAARAMNAQMGAGASGAGKLSGALGLLSSKGFMAAEALGMGWVIGDMLNNFDIVRKAGASLIYGFDRVMLAAKKMWKFISGGDVGAVDREIEAAKKAYEGLIEDIEKGQDDWSKEQRGEQTTRDVFREARRNKGRKDAEGKTDDDKRRAAGELSQDLLEEEFGAENGGTADSWNEEADRRRDRLAEIDEELADKRREREERAFDEELARRERLAAVERGDQSDENSWADRLEREKELPGAEEALRRQEELHERRMAQLAEERKAASEQGDDEALEAIGKKEREEEEAHEDETARIEHEQRLRYIALEEEAAQAAHENALARIEAEAEARKQAHERQLEDIRAEREEVEAAHEEKMALLAEELAAAQESGDKKAIREAEKNIEREEKGYEKETARLDKEEKKAIQAEARAKQDDERKKDDEQASYAREQDKLKLKADKENKEEEARKKEREKARQAAEKEEAERRAAEAAAAAKAEEEARTEAEIEAAEEADKEREAAEEKRRRKEEERERRRARQAAREQRVERAEPERDAAEQERRGQTERAKRDLATVRDAFAETEQTAQDALVAQTAAAEEAAKAAEENAKKWQESQRQAAEKAASAVEGYYQRLKSASDDVAGRQKSLAEELLELDTTKSEKQKWQELAKQAADYEKQAKAAMEAGDLDRAKELADLARSSWSRLKGGAEGIDGQQAGRQVYSGVKSAGELGIAIAKLQEQQAAQDARKQANIAANLARNLAPAVQQAQAVVDGGQARGGGQAQPGQPSQVDRVHELRFNGGSLRGGEGDIEAFLRGLEQAGMTA